MEAPPIWLYLTTMCVLFSLNVAMAAFALRYAAHSGGGFWGWLCIVGALFAAHGFLGQVLPPGDPRYHVVRIAQSVTVAVILVTPPYLLKKC